MGKLGRADPLIDKGAGEHHIVLAGRPVFRSPLSFEKDRSMSDDPVRHPPVDAAKAGLKGRCPRCGEGRLFAGILRLEPRCEDCGLDFTPFDSADGPAFFVMTIVGFLIVGLALYVEVVHSPSVWVHLILWPIIAALLTMPLLRLSKGLMVGLQYRNRAGQGEVVRHGED